MNSIHISTCAGYLLIRPGLKGKTNYKRRTIMLFYTHLIIPWEQHNEQVSSLATRTPKNTGQNLSWSLVIFQTSLVTVPIWL
jgi:hypothetical protein